MKPDFWEHTGDGAGREMDYRRIWRINFSMACLITLTPLVLVALYCFMAGSALDHLLLWVLGCCGAAALASVYIGTLRQVERLYKLDIHRSEVLKEIVYTHRMASVGRLASGVAHEINNPMAVIRERAGLVEDLIARDGSGCDLDRIGELARGIQDNCARASAITHRLLGLGRHLRLELEELDPVQVINDVVGLFRQKSRYRRISVQVEAVSALPVVTSDRVALEQIALTLLDNAFEVLPDGGSIDIHVAASNSGQLRLVFHDNGPGIPKEDLNHVFEPFFSARKGEHAGLGLSITYGIVHKLGGEIHVESDEGEGATFSVILPLSPPVEEDHAAELDIGIKALHAKGPGD